MWGRRQGAVCCERKSHFTGKLVFVYYTSSPIHRAKELVFEGNTSILPKVLVINEPKVREIRKQAVNRR